MTIEELRERKKNLKITTRELAVLADLPQGTVSKILTGETKNPSYLLLSLLCSLHFLLLFHSLHSFLLLFVHFLFVLLAHLRLLPFLVFRHYFETRFHYFLR